MSKSKNQTISCNVDSCSFNDCDEHLCELKEIKVSCTCDHDSCNCKSETICDSFEEKE